MVLFVSSGAAEVAEVRNRYLPYPPVANPAVGISWPKGQALPVFAKPAATLDMVAVQDLTRDEQITFSALQGLVNKQQPRIYLLNSRSEVGVDTWANTPTINLGPGNWIEAGRKYELVAKYAKDLAGVVLYNPDLNPHYRNLAGTIAGLKNALPVTVEVLGQMKDHGIALGVLVDLTGLTFSSPVEIYQYLYDKYWPGCEKRLILSAKPYDEKGGGDYSHTRDIAAASGAAVVWLDCRIQAEKLVFQKFLGDMKAGEAVALGWYSTERSGITTVSAYGIGTMPSDHFFNGSVFAGMDHRIHIPKVPKKPELHNKIYVAVFISDGDNI